MRKLLGGWEAWAKGAISEWIWERRVGVEWIRVRSQGIRLWVLVVVLRFLATRVYVKDLKFRLTTISGEDQAGL